MDEQEKLGESAEKADHKCRKIYNRIQELVLDRETLKQELQEQEEEQERYQIQLKISRIDREFNELLNVLSMDSMEF